MWLTAPLLLALLPPLLLIVHRMTRSAHLAHLAEVDVKTRLHNTRYFEGVLDEELARGRRAGRAAGLLFADLDHFKRINDRYGHVVGDRVLHEIAGVLTHSLRNGDVVARWGGEEFVALLPGTGAEQAIELAERVRKAVDHHLLVLEDGTQVHCTISIGVAACPEDGVDGTTLLKRADNALYRAKRTRNSVAQPEDSAPVRVSSIKQCPRLLNTCPWLGVTGHFKISQPGSNENRLL